MKYEKIHELLDRYWEGETSLEEERSIKEYFNAPGIDERLRPLAPMFQAFSEEQTVQLASKTKVVPMRPQMYQWAVAASLALMLAAGWWMLREGETVKAVAGIPAAESPQTTVPAVAPEKSLTATGKKEIEKALPPIKKNPWKPRKPKTAIDPETARAMAEIKAALALVSSKLDKGRNEAVKGASLLEAIEKVPKRKAG